MNTTGNKVIELTDSSEIAELFSYNPKLHLYELGDLDEHHKPYTSYHTLDHNFTEQPITMFYQKLRAKTLIFKCNEVRAEHLELLHKIQDKLPETFYAHISEGLAQALKENFTLSHFHPMHQISGAWNEKLAAINIEDVIELNIQHSEKIQELYKTAYPDHWFEESMLEQGKQVGVMDGDKIVATVGTHIYSEKYSVAALGNLSVHPECKGKGLAKKCMAKLAKILWKKVEHLGENVKKENHAALSLYSSLGLEICGNYEEYLCTRKA